MALDIGLRRKRNREGSYFPWKVFYRFVASQIVLVLVALSAVFSLTRYFFKHQFVTDIRKHAVQTVNQFAAEVIRTGDSTSCDIPLAKGEIEVSLFRLDGTLICHSHLDRHGKEEPDIPPEVRRATEKVNAFDVRKNAQGVLTLYDAVTRPEKAFIIRVGVPLTALEETLSVFDTSMMIATLLISLAILALSVWSTRRLVFPLGRLILKTKMNHPTDSISSDEFSENSFDEWLELESNIDNIRKDLLLKTQSLTLEQVELDTIMGSISEAILAVDPQGNPLFYNTRFELLFGNDGILKRNVKLWGIFRDPVIIDAFVNALKEGKTTAARVVPLEVRSIRNYFALSVSPLRREDQSIYGAVGVLHDVTSLKSAEQMRIDFVANVSHELRTPLTSIKGYVDTLIDDAHKQRPISEEFLTIIARNTERLLNLMNDLLDLSSLESEGSRVQKDHIDTKDLTQQVVESLQETFDRKKQKFEAIYNAPTVYCDPERLEQVLINLLNNASKYSPEGADIKVMWNQERHDTVVRVFNSGAGIPVEHQPRLFERFYRVDKARSREQGGTGLGLAIVKHIMQSHGGSISLESRPGEGATFICRFPIAQNNHK